MDGHKLYLIRLWLKKKRNGERDLEVSMGPMPACMYWKIFGLNKYLPLFQVQWPQFEAKSAGKSSDEQRGWGN